jgi:hypothetical protein
MSYLFNKLVTLSNRDAFGRTTVSQPFTLADYSHVFGEAPELISLVNGVGSTISVVPNEASIRLIVGTADGDYAIHQSRMYHHYMPGKSQLILESFCFGGTTSIAASKRIGYFDDRDGVFFQQDGSGNLSFVQRSYVTGTAVDLTFTQSHWNKDKCDGSGQSGFNLDVTKSQLLFFDYQWLGVGRLRCGFVHDGENVIAHEVYHSNNLSTVYWSNPSLPIRCEVRNISSSTSTASMDQICASVMSEGGYEGSGIDFAAASELRYIETLFGTLPCIAIRLKNNFNGFPNRVTVRPGMVDMLGLNNPFKYEIWRLPGTSSIIGGDWISAGDDSSVEYNISATGWTATGGNLFNVGLIAASSTTKGGGATTPIGENVQTITSSKRGFISQNFDSTGSNIFAVIVTALEVTGGSCSFYGTMQWRETR